MAMRGDGSKEYPFEITSCEELQYAMLHGNSGSGSTYYRVMKNLDCNDEKLYEWNVTDGGSTSIFNWEIDFNGKYLTNVNIKEGGYFCNVSRYAAHRVMKNGAIVNVYENNAKGFSNGIGYENMAIDVHTDGFDVIPFIFNKSVPAQMFNLCNIIYDCRGSQLNTLFKQVETALSSTAETIVKNSKLTINGIFNGGAVFMGGKSKTSVPYPDIAQGCLFEGKIKLDNALNPVLTDVYSISSCIVNIDFEGDASIPLRITGRQEETHEKNVYNADKYENWATEGRVIYADESQITNPDWLTSNGFFVGKED